MINTDKLINAIQPVIIETINSLVKQGNIQRLRQWLVECDEEIKLREMKLKEFSTISDNEYYRTMIYPLNCERVYLQMVTG
jgi:hypothetical protein